MSKTYHHRNDCPAITQTQAHCICYPKDSSSEEISRLKSALEAEAEQNADFVDFVKRGKAHDWNDARYKNGQGFLCLCGHRATRHGKDGVIGYCVHCGCNEFKKDDKSEDVCRFEYQAKPQSYWSKLAAWKAEVVEAAKKWVEVDNIGNMDEYDNACANLANALDKEPKL